MLFLGVEQRQGVQPQLLEKVFLALVESPAVLKLYKYIFDIQRLVDSPIRKLFSRGSGIFGCGRLVPINPFYLQ